MNGRTDSQGTESFFAAIEVGDLCGGVISEIGRSHATVVLDGLPGRALGRVGSLDLPWGNRRLDALDVGRRITARVTGVDLTGGLVHLSMAATAHPELWAFLAELEQDRILPDSDRAR
ncbi:hypothetical protein ACIQ9P_39020 [Kitasatospora sp. NPDC094019]|uniref:hypothetical protein n=1 Tax=Kitasatospora sp. NPDC094019 TaxID=3364091 RepID=UPI0037FAACE8